ncbi:MAG: endonuclease/exonuclease/phosphatase family protein [Candidatus Marinimicrobia bacterium]|nr:endonuclease/exonuclease/phosphatase family protein [Candidatus Neomarinimicrobiota bacterium]MCF7922661.1 endonuclease/exonuclease/phosphatase family protein [Candidatus Neomarinimicrobiota bacterium]
MGFLLLVVTLVFIQPEFVDAQTYNQKFDAPEYLKIHLLFTNDLHGGIAPSQAWFMNPEFPPDLGGGASMYTYVQEIRKEAAAEGAEVLLLDGGNIFQGTPLGMADSGRAMIDWMNDMKYDASVIGMQEFMFGMPNIARLDQQSQFPLLGSNLSSAEYSPQDHLIKNYQGVKLGIFGLSPANTPNKLLPEQTEGVAFGREISTAKAQVKLLKEQGANCIIGLSNLGVPYQREDEFAEFVDTYEDESDFGDRLISNLELGHLVPGIDLIVSGGTNAGYNTPWEDPQTHTLIIQGYGGASNIGHIILYIHRSTGTLAGYQEPFSRGVLLTLSTDDIQPDRNMAKYLTDLEATRSHPGKRDFSQARKSQQTTPSVPLNRWKFDVPNFGRDNYLEVMTWNMEWFPKAKDSTITAVAEIMQKVNADVYAVQEIGSLEQFAAMMALLPEYDFQVTRQSSFFDQAILYKRAVLAFVGREEPFSHADYNFAGRPPLRLDFVWEVNGQKEPVSIINLHLKCCGNGLERRKKSMEELHEYLSLGMEFGEENIIVLGDWNDQLDDVGVIQSFTAFLDDPEHFRFATDRIAGDVAQASYPTWPSFLDHILIARGFFDEFENQSTIQTLPVADWLGSWENYELIISDHRPVLMQLNMAK